ncbi:hypothetical protein ES319_D03G134400v1 [Gossypium barbadense]|uniref:Uncharacterized protein n=1 Tax=Gossypium barbadense TaxID=3634 RepID=A0A5J5S460_GOSBA|nr:hypothetical protein ES319_D03G134400v1 [Gossypium barbadense]
MSPTTSPISQHSPYTRPGKVTWASQSSLVTNALTEFESPPLLVVSSPQSSFSTIQFGSLPPSPSPMMSASPSIVISHSNDQ